MLKNFEFNIGVYRKKNIQTIRDTFLAYFAPPLPHVSFGDTGK
jgi:hypothetical protein